MARSYSWCAPAGHGVMLTATKAGAQNHLSTSSALRAMTTVQFASQRTSTWLARTRRTLPVSGTRRCVVDGVKSSSTLRLSGGIQGWEWVDGSQQRGSGPSAAVDLADQLILYGHQSGNRGKAFVILLDVCSY